MELRNWRDLISQFYHSDMVMDIVDGLKICNRHLRNQARILGKVCNDQVPMQDGASKNIMVWSETGQGLTGRCFLLLDYLYLICYDVAQQLYILVLNKTDIALQSTMQSTSSAVVEKINT